MLCIAVLYNAVLYFSFNLGDGTVYIQSSDAITLNEWHVVEITRSGKTGSMRVDDSDDPFTVESDGVESELSVEGNIYIGGFRGEESPFRDVSVGNFSGCIEEVYLGLDSADLNDYVEAVNTQRGCKREVRTQQLFLHEIRS